jgi:hypothetical protein
MSEFYDNEFERFLQQQVKQHRMYPSDAVWKGIYQQIHGEKKWPGLYFIAILLIAALSVCTIFMDSKPIIYSQQKVANNTVPAIDHMNPEQVTKATLKSLNEDRQEASSYALQEPIAVLPETLPIPEDRTYTIVIDRDADNENELRSSADEGDASLQSGAALGSPETTERAIDAVSNKTLKAEEKIEEEVKETSKVEEPKAAEETAETTPIIVKKKDQKINRWQYEVYITPASNYKQTVDSKITQGNFNGPSQTNYGVSADEVIRYKPGMGVEFGFGVLYNVSNRFRFKTGFQYNIRQYNIEAYAGSTELASIALRNGASIATVAKYRSSSATSNEALLLNKYHQVALPIGFEYSIIRNSAIGVNVAYSLQPTYTFSQSSYLLTSDYKSYADGTSMLRRWNINSGLEATISMNVGDFQWKFGPQLRYQHLPTYTSQYPIKEYLIDYGFKIGFTKTIR